MVATRHVSIEEFTSMLNTNKWELVNGELAEVAPALGLPSRVRGRICAQFVLQIEEKALGWAYPADAGFILFDDRSTVHSPAAAFVSKDWLPKEPKVFVPVAPDLAVEVLSPSGRMANALVDVAMYLDVGVLLVWLVDPEQQMVTIFQPNAAIDIVNDDATLSGGEVAPDLSIPLAAIFSHE